MLDILNIIYKIYQIFDKYKEDCNKDYLYLIMEEGLLGKKFEINIT